MDPVSKAALYKHQVISFMTEWKVSKLHADNYESEGLSVHDRNGRCQGHISLRFGVGEFFLYTRDGLLPIIV